MKIHKFKFQFKPSGGEWETITDTEFMDKLYKYHNRVTPIIKDMLATGRSHGYPDGEYMICQVV